MMAHIHTKLANADKIQALLNAVELLGSQCRTLPQNVLAIKIESLGHLAIEAEQALAELRNQTGIT